MPETVCIRIDGEPVTVVAGCTVAAALWNASRMRFRTSVQGEPRGPLCGMGICFECRVTVDGEAQVRSCQVLCRDGMRIETGGRTDA